MLCSLGMQSTLRELWISIKDCNDLLCVFVVFFFPPIKPLSRLRVDVSVTGQCGIVVALLWQHRESRSPGSPLHYRAASLSAASDCSPGFSIPVPSQPLIPPAPGTEQTKQIVFAPSTEPAFVTVPQNSFGEPFVLNPNTWSLVVEAEGVLLVRTIHHSGGFSSSLGASVPNITNSPVSPPRIIWFCYPARTMKRQYCS